jgi:rod shape-determining protein MreD|tara:strand:+ start:394 stop:912 length:519 start_codon:yes stop_codon:yes gene_type:complete
MAIIYKNFVQSLFRILPLILLYFLSITELDTEFSNMFEILSFNLQLIVVYYWMLKNPSVLGSGHVFFAGIINDVITGLPMGTSSLGYLLTSFVALYIRNVTVNKSLFTDWFTFIIAIFFSYLTFIILISNYSSYTFSYVDLFYNSFFTFLFFPLFWAIFETYKNLVFLKKDD